MLNYAFGKNKKNLFITHYLISNDLIYVYYSNGSFDKIPYNTQNLNLLEEKMRKQITNYKPILPGILLTFEFIAVSFLAPMSYELFKNAVLLPESAYAGITGASAVLFAFLSIKNANIIRDHKKNTFFLKNENVINEGIDSNTEELKIENTVRKMSEKGKGKIYNLRKSEDLLTINSIDNMSLKDLKTLKENLVRSNSFEYDYTKVEDTAIFDGPTLTKK